MTSYKSNLLKTRKELPFVKDSYHKSIPLEELKPKEPRKSPEVPYLTTAKPLRCIKSENREVEL